MKKIIISIVTVLLIMGSSFSFAQSQKKDMQNDLSPFALRFKASLPYSMLLTNLKSDTFDGDDDGGVGFNTNLDLVYYFYKDENFAANISLGLGFTNYRQFRTTSYQKIYVTTDIDGDDVRVTETVNGLLEKQKLNSIDIPLQLGFDLRLSDNLDIYMSAGIIYGIKSKSTYESKATITRTGYYPDFHALIFDVDVDGSPYFYPTNKAMKTTDDLTTKNNFSLIGSLGLIHKISSKFSVLVGVKYVYGLTDVIDVADSKTIIKHDGEYHYSLNSLANRGDKIKARAFGMEIGIQYNFWKLF